MVATNSVERAKRLEAELELEKLKNLSSDSMFSNSEESDYEYILKQLDQYIPIHFSKKDQKESNSNDLDHPDIKFNVNVLSLIIYYSKRYRYEFKYNRFKYWLAKKGKLPNKIDYKNESDMCKNE